MKRCPACRTEKPSDEFYRMKSGKLSCYCKPCSLATNRCSKYDLTEAELQQMIAAQRSRCAICKTAVTGRNLQIDHDHTTGKVRGILCNRCNWAIGLLKDDASVVRSAIRYLSRRKEVPDVLF